LVSDWFDQTPSRSGRFAVGLPCARAGAAKTVMAHANSEYLSETGMDLSSS
jgi:hypothetical protein